MYKLTDREMLTMAYGVLRANASTEGEKIITQMIYAHLSEPAPRKCECPSPAYKIGDRAVCANCDGVIL